MKLNTTLKSHPFWTLSGLQYEYDDINIDVSLDNGPILTSTGVNIGSYKFYSFTDYLGQERDILKCIVGDKQNPEAFFFLNRAGDFEYIGFTHFHAYDDFEINNGIQCLVKFIDNPLLLNDIDWQALQDLFFGSSKPIFKNGAFKTSFTYKYFTKVLDVLKNGSNPDFEKKLDSFGSYYFFETLFNSLDSELIAKLYDNLYKNWYLISLNAKLILLSRWKVGNAAAINTLGGMLIVLLAELIASYPATTIGNLGLRRSKIVGLLSTFKSVIINLGTDPLIRDTLIKNILLEIRDGDYYTQASQLAIDFIYEAIIKSNQVVFDAAPYENLIKQIVAKTLLKPSLQVATRIFNNFNGYLDQSYRDYRTTLNELIDTVIYKYTGNISAESNFLLSALNWDHDRKSNILNVLRPYNWTQSVLPTILSALTEYGDRKLPDSIDKAAFFQGLAVTLKNRFNERPLVDSWWSVYDWTLKLVISLMKYEDNDKYVTYANFLLPVLHNLNPQQPTESLTQYQSRIQHIEILFLDYGIFLYDLKGGTFQTPAFLDVIESFAKTHNRWVDVVVLCSVEGGEAKQGVVQANWVDVYKTPYMLGEMLLHEGGHALELYHLYENRDLDVLVNYWFYENKQRDLKDYPSSYAGTNTREYIAEFMRYWYIDGVSWLKEAITRYTNKKPALLNIFVFLWLKFARGKLHILKNDGIIDWQSVPIKLTDSLFNGDVVIETSDDTYFLDYQDYKITKLLKLSEQIPPEPQPEPKPEPKPEPEPQPEENEYEKGYSDGVKDTQKQIVDKISQLKLQIEKLLSEFGV